jgi:UTP--glucose-1-phosphate uridylyltransferase
MKKIVKAVFPVAGFGTRFLPVTKASPKEMLPIVDKPLIQYAVEEAIAAGIRDIIFVTSHGKRAIEDHFDHNRELEAKLTQQGEVALLDAVTNIIPDHVNCIYVRQPKPKGLGDAILCAAPLIAEDEAFAVLLADDLIDPGTQPNCLQQMVAEYERHHCPVVAVQQIPPSETTRYGMVGFDADHKVKKIVEKPHPSAAPSNFGVVGRYILPGSIFKILLKLQQAQTTAADTMQELQLTDAISALVQNALPELPDLPMFAYEFKGTRYDCGDKLGYLTAIVNYALQHPQLGSDFAQVLAKSCASNINNENNKNNSDSNNLTTVYQHA